jgi:hypothetical protein
LKPIEVELRRIEDVITEIVNDMDYLRYREQSMRNTNESTNERVKGFAVLTSIILPREIADYRSCVARIVNLANCLSSNIFQA